MMVISANAKIGENRTLKTMSLIIHLGMDKIGNPSKTKNCLMTRAVKRGLPQSSKSSSISGRILPATNSPMFATVVSNAETKSSSRWLTSSEKAGQILLRQSTALSAPVEKMSKTWLTAPTIKRTSATHGALATTSALSTTRLAESKMRFKARLPIFGPPFQNSTQRKARSCWTALSTSKSTANGTTILRTTESLSTKLKVNTSEHLNCQREMCAGGYLRGILPALMLPASVN